MSNLPVVYQPQTEMEIAGQQANRHASAHVFQDYRQRIAANTLRRQDTDLALLESFLRAANLYVCNLNTGAECWHGITWGIVAAFVQWQLGKGYAVGSINVRLATIKRYAELAHQAGVISAEEHALIKTVKGYGFKQAKKVDEKRETKRLGDKKAEATKITKEQADLLKFPLFSIKTRLPLLDTPQRRRDALLMCLLLDHGLRCGEIAALEVTAFDLKAKVFKFHRPKVDKIQTHKMTGETLLAATLYLKRDAPLAGKLLLGSRKGGALGGAMSERAINKRVEILGKAIGVQHLSPHDLRHYWATRAATMGTSPFDLQDAGGWNSLAMPRRYVDHAKIANEGVKL